MAEIHPTARSYRVVFDRLDEDLLASIVGLMLAYGVQIHTGSFERPNNQDRQPQTGRIDEGRTVTVVDLTAHLQAVKPVFEAVVEAAHVRHLEVLPKVVFVRQILGSDTAEAWNRQVFGSEHLLFLAHMDLSFAGSIVPAMLMCQSSASAAVPDCLPPTKTHEDFEDVPVDAGLAFEAQMVSTDNCDHSSTVLAFGFFWQSHFGCIPW